ncbi:CPBP family intramembrane metalloprotease [Tissierella sp. MSJ-40]|uniref:CPBP family intramembrane metalloprotease n=1 Tax=Tissierella simiarum TaxID=2841534 RepID=A0ABS6EAE6_9FIRM|nr:type II CAAX endopeptidase family protein [Tissierella simiarum]MBU5439907.1 CPBP family intramembrane metalloprotease [Tissierella simiarum]
MEYKILRKEKSIFKVNLFFLVTLAWSVLIQFMPIPSNSYQYIAFLIPIAIYLIINRNHSERILRPNLLNFKSILIIFGIWMCMLPVVILIIEFYTSFFGSTLADIVAEDAHELFIWNLFFTAITPAILEEILMRGIVLDGYRNKSRMVAALVNGLMFGMLHLNSFQFFHTFVAGFIASYVVFATNSIFGGILIHFINNGFPLFMDKLFPADPNVGYAGDTNYLLYTIMAILGAMGVYKLIKLLFKVNNTPIVQNKYISNEKIFNMPLIISILVFTIFSAAIILLI